MSRPQQTRDPTLDFFIIIGIVLCVYLVVRFLVQEDYQYLRLTIYKYYLTGYKFIYDLLPFNSAYFDNLYDSLTLYEPNEYAKDQVIYIEHQMRFFIIIPLGLIIFFLYFYSFRGTYFNRIFNRETLILDQMKLWSFIKPISKLKLDAGAIEKGEWAMSKRPLDFCKKYSLLDENNVVIEDRANIIFSTKQMGRLFIDYEHLRPYEKALLICFIAHSTRTDEGKSEAIKWLKHLSNTYENLDCSWVDDVWKKYKDHPNVKIVFSEHAYVTTVLTRALELARTGGVLPPSYFYGWLKPLDRNLYFTLNRLGGKETFTECAGPFNHYLAEKMIEKPILRQYTLGATAGLKEAISKFKITNKNYYDLEVE